MSPRDTRISSSKYVMSSVPFADSGALIGMMPPILNCSNCTATSLADMGVRPAVTLEKVGLVSLFRAFSFSPSSTW